jgi:hypothetical protein
LGGGRDVDERGAGGFGGQSAPRDYLTNIFGGEASTYERIDRLWDVADDQRQTVDRLLASAIEIQGALYGDTGESDAAAAQIAEARRAAWRAHHLSGRRNSGRRCTPTIEVSVAAIPRRTPSKCSRSDRRAERDVGRYPHP